MEFASLLRQTGAVAGPAGVLAFGAFVAALLTVGPERVDTSALAVASSGLLLVAVLGIGAAALAALARLGEAGAGLSGPGIAVVGTVLVAGGTWAAVFVQPALAAEFPEALERQLDGVVVGYIASYVIFSLGWVWMGITLVRSRLVPRWLGVLTAIAGLLSFVPSPEPLRLLLIAVAATLLARRLAVHTPAPDLVSQPG